jgi:mannose-6-phosphate isomerase-like protein (cupin superfamily)
MPTSEGDGRGRAVDIQAALAPLRKLTGRQPNDPRAGEAFARLAEYRDGAIFAGSFDGDSEWERHRNGDELVQILAGETEVTLMLPEGAETLHLSAGMLVVVPQGVWHRFHAPQGVTLMTVTPQPTDHTEDPTAEA